LSTRPINACSRKETSVNYGKSAGGTNKRAGKNDRFPQSVLDFAVVNAEDPELFHPTQKPVQLLEWLIQTYSNKDDIVLDPCFGSGTTAVAAKLHKRRFIGFEKDRNFFEKAQSRLQGWGKGEK
jgi:DNA modification methylase